MPSRTPSQEAGQVSTGVKAVRYPAVTSTSLAEQARKIIEQTILDGTLAPDERIPIETVAQELGVSRTPVREALKALEREGLVALVPHRGAVVAALAPEDLDHRYEVRAMIEGYAAELSCSANPEPTTVLLDEICAETREIVDSADAETTENVRSLVALNERFHAAIHTSTGSPTVIRLLTQLRNPLRFSLSYWSARDRQLVSLKSHEEITDAFRSRDPKLARHLAERHLLDARDRLAQGDAFLNGQWYE
jgi:GntR family transcriptional regulator, vanillate catabolism transcriptional regulator